MKKSTKGALAATAAGVLLLGGAGSLAYWSDTASIAGGSVNSGKLKLTDTTAGTCATAAWTLDAAEAGGTTFDPATDTLVPGDVLTKQCTYTIAAAGKHLRATVATTGGATTGTLAPALKVAGTFSLGSTPVTSITSANDGNTLVADLKVTFDPASDNATQLKAGSLSDFVVTLSQVHS